MCLEKSIQTLSATLFRRPSKQRLRISSWPSFWSWDMLILGVRPPRTVGVFVGDELVRDPATPLGESAAVDVLPPFAGG